MVVRVKVMTGSHVRHILSIRIMTSWAGNFVAVLEFLDCIVALVVENKGLGLKKSQLKVLYRNSGVCVNVQM